MQVKDNNGPPRSQFLRYSYAVDSIAAAFRTRNKKGKIYQEGVGEKDKSHFKKYLLHYVMNLWLAERELTKDEMLAAIERLSEVLSSKYGDIPVKGRFRIGISQKVICVYAKFLWVSGMLKSPPSLIPYDGIIKDAIGISVLPNWTELDSMDEYLSIIEDIERVSAGNPAQWELENWNDKAMPKNAGFRSEYLGERHKEK